MDTIIKKEAQSHLASDQRVLSLTLKLLMFYMQIKNVARAKWW